MTDIVYNKNGIAFDIDAIATDVNGKMDRDGLNATASVCVESYQNGTSWYRVYSDGWCEQGGVANAGTSSVTFLKPFTNTNYYVTAHTVTNDLGVTYHSIIGNKYTTSFEIASGQYGSNPRSLQYNASWQACGYIR